jgi:hypothetical protein
MNHGYVDEVVCDSDMDEYDIIDEFTVKEAEEYSRMVEKLQYVKGGAKLARFIDWIISDDFTIENALIHIGYPAEVASSMAANDIIHIIYEEVVNSVPLALRATVTLSKGHIMRIVQKAVERAIKRSEETRDATFTFVEALSPEDADMYGWTVLTPTN